MECGEFTTCDGPHGWKKLSDRVDARVACSSHRKPPAGSSEYHLSQAAERDLEQIYLSWAQSEGVAAADRLFPGLVYRFLLLRDVPDASRPADHVEPGVRVCAAGRFLIYYRPSGMGIEILHVFHGPRNQGR
jgi:plasmid stabilization system protein ParE